MSHTLAPSVFGLYGKNGFVLCCYFFKNIEWLFGFFECVSSIKITIFDQKFTQIVQNNKRYWLWKIAPFWNPHYMCIRFKWCHWCDCIIHILFGVANEFFIWILNTKTFPSNLKWNTCKLNLNHGHLEIAESVCLETLQTWNVEDPFCELKTLGFSRKLALKFVSLKIVALDG